MQSEKQFYITRTLEVRLDQKKKISSTLYIDLIKNTRETTNSIGKKISMGELFSKQR